MQPIRFYSVQTNTDTKLEKTANAEEPETDILYKRLELEIRGHDPAVMRSYVHFATTAAEHLNIEVGKRWASVTERVEDFKISCVVLRFLFSWRPRSPYNVERYTVLKSAFVHKKHRVQYEFRTHFHFIHFHRLTGSTLSTFLEYIERNLPEGVALKVTKIEMLALSEHLQKPPPTVVSEQRE